MQCHATSRDSPEDHELVLWGIVEDLSEPDSMDINVPSDGWVFFKSGVCKTIGFPTLMDKLNQYYNHGVSNFIGIFSFISFYKLTNNLDKFLCSLFWETPILALSLTH